MSYFAGRVAPLGALPAPAVEAMTYGFSPTIVARAIPDAWTFASSPQAVPGARMTSAPRRCGGTPHDPLLGVRRANWLSDLLWQAIDVVAGSTAWPLAAAWAAVPRPGDQVAALWLAATVLREHRGDGHVLAGVAHGLRGLDANG